MNDDLILIAAALVAFPAATLILYMADRAWTLLRPGPGAHRGPRYAGFEDSTEVHLCDLFTPETGVLAYCAHDQRVTEQLVDADGTTLCTCGHVTAGDQ